MSRYVVKSNEKVNFIYGFDHALGYFYEIWDKNNDETPLVEKTYLFNKLSKSEMAEKMEEYGAKWEHIQSLALDVPF